MQRFSHFDYRSKIQFRSDLAAESGVGSQSLN
jgi:hypothetical protein